MERNKSIKVSDPVSSSPGLIGFIMRHFVWVGIAFAVSFWVIESAIHVFILNDGAFAKQLFKPSANELWMRTTIGVLLVGFGGYIQWTLRKIEGSRTLALSASSSQYKRHIALAVFSWTVIIAVLVAWNMYEELGNAHADTRNHVFSMILGHGFVWLVVVLGILYGGERFQRQLTGRMQAEKELHESERRMREMLANMRLATVIVERDGTITFVNNYLLEITGHSHLDVVGANWFDMFIPEEERQRLREVHEDVLAHKLDSMGRYENEILTSDGCRRLIAWNNTLFHYSPEGDILGTTSLGEDITEQRKARQEAKKYHYYLERAQEIGNIGTWELDIPENKLVWTPETYRIFGIPLGTPLTYEIFLNCVHPEDRESVDAEWSAAMQGNPYEIEHRITVDGNVKWVREKALLEFDADGNCTRGTGFAQDISKRKLVEEALQKSRELYDRVVESMSDGILVLDKHFHYVYWNCAMERISHVPRSELIGSDKLPWEVFPHIKEQGVDEMMKSAMKGIETARNNICYRLPDGTQEFTSEIFVPLRDGAGEVMGIVGVVRDVTVQKLAEEQARLHQAELLHMSRLSTMGEIASGLAHEINQPLCAAINYTNASLRMLRALEINDDKVIGSMEAAAAQIERAGEIVNSIKNFVRKRRPDRTSVDVNELIRGLTDFIGSDLGKHNVEYRLDLAETLGMAEADFVQIEQVLMNLLLNAIEAMSDTPKEHRQLTVRTAKYDHCIEVAVSDTGKGLDDHTVQKAFDSFYTTKPQGLGIGLSISKSIIEMHKGTIAAMNNKDRGATFTFTLPTTQLQPYNSTKNPDACRGLV